MFFFHSTVLKLFMLTVMYAGELCGCPPFDPYSKTNCASNIGLPNEEFTYMCRDGYTTSTDGKQYIAKCFNGEWTTFGLCTGKHLYSLYVCMYVCISVCIYVCMYVCMYLYIQSTLSLVDTVLSGQLS